MGGAAVGYAGEPTTFHTVAERWLPKLQPDDLRWLADDDAPVVRSLGLMGLALIGDQTTVIQHFCDRETVRWMPGGCDSQQFTVGQVAQTFAHAPTMLVDPWSPGEPLLGDAEALRLQTQVLAADACRYRAGFEPEIVSLEQLRAAVPDAPPWMPVKAFVEQYRWGVWDTDTSDKQDLLDVLRRVLLNPSEPDSARLAAASALTLPASSASARDDARAALSETAAFLDAQRPGLSETLLETLALQQQVETLIASDRTPDILGAIVTPHPFVLHQAFGFNRDKVMQAAWRTTLLLVSERLSEHRDCWSAYRRTAYLLLDYEEFFREDGDGFAPAHTARLRRNVLAEQRLLDADLACR